MKSRQTALRLDGVLDRARATLPLATLAGALGASFWAQRLLRTTSDDRGLFFVGCAFVLAVVTGRLHIAYPAPESPPAPSLRPVRHGWLVVGAVALAIVLVLQRLGQAPLVQIGGLLISLVAWITAYQPHAWRFRDDPRLRRATQAALVTISLASCLWALDRIPGGLYGDEGSHGLVVRGLLDGTEIVPPFSVGWGEVPTLFTWMEAAGVALIGGTIGGLRLTAAIGGGLSVLPWFGMLRRELGWVVAAASALLLCASPAHQHLSRIALPEAWIRLCAFAAMGALFVALRTGRAAAFVAAGVALGGTFYMASKAVLLPPIMLGGALFLLAAARTNPLQQWRGAVLLIAAAALTFLPELVDYATRDWYSPLVGHPGRWMNTPHPDGPAGHAAEVARLLLDRIELSPFSPFTPPSRIVTEVEGALMVVGLGLCVARPRRPIAAFLLGWLVAGLGSLLLDGRPNQLPHALLVSCLPAAFAAIVLHTWQEVVTRLFGRPIVGVLAAAACAVPLILANGAAYFGHGAGAAPWEAGDVTELGNAMQEHRDTHHVALVTVPMSWDINSTLCYLAPGFKAPTKLTELDPDEPWFDNVQRDVAFLVLPDVTRLLQSIRERYPAAPVELRKSAAGDPLLAIVRVPATEVRRVEQSLRSASPIR